jgi:hypothetical protein
MMNRINDALQDFLKTRPEVDVLLEKTKETFGTWQELQGNVDPSRVSEIIQSLLPGQSFALYVRQQNSGLLLTVLEDYSDGKQQEAVDDRGLFPPKPGMWWGLGGIFR